MELALQMIGIAIRIINVTQFRHWLVRFQLHVVTISLVYNSNFYISFFTFDVNYQYFTGFKDQYVLWRWSEKIRNGGKIYQV